MVIKYKKERCFVKITLTVENFFENEFEFIELGYFVSDNSIRYKDIEMMNEASQEDYILTRRQFLNLRKQYIEWFKNYK